MKLRNLHERINSESVAFVQDGRYECESYRTLHVELVIQLDQEDDVPTLGDMLDPAWLSALAARLDVERCRACPVGCRSCSRDESNCECYSHAGRHPLNVRTALESVIERLKYPAALEDRAIGIVKEIAREHWGIDLDE